MNWSLEDIQSITEHGLAVTRIEAQLALLKEGAVYTQLARAAVPGDGIIVLSDDEKQQLAQIFIRSQQQLDIIKFVPASGAATRMFKDLQSFALTGKINDTVTKFIGHIGDFAFSEQLKANVNYPDNPQALIQFLLDQQGMNYAAQPKAFIPFHKDQKKKYTPIDSHLEEAIDYSTDREGTIALHFTFSPDHLEEAEQKIWSSVFEIEEKYGVESFIQLSTQLPETDTVALNSKREILRDKNGKIVFRPGGHGALLKNLQQTEADLIFIRNIDNILPPTRKTENVFYKKVLGGFLLQFREKLYVQMRELKKNNLQAIEEIKRLFNSCSGSLPAKLMLSHNTNEWLVYLNKPIRVCAMVRNEGEPGGGPFWVKDDAGNTSLQIVESAQISKADDQQEIFKSATHFNPVDLVCAVKSFDGSCYTLGDFVDYRTSFITEKTFEGEQIRVLEHPGLWNGAMANWITFFIEVPSSTFNPVKSVVDLLRPNHLS